MAESRARPAKAMERQLQAAGLQQSNSPPLGLQLASSFLFELGEIAGADLAPAINRALPGDAAAAYLLVDPARRHAWNIVLMNRETESGRTSDGCCGELTALLLQAPIRQLLAMAFGEWRAGLQTVLNQLPVCSLTREGYRHLVGAVGKAYQAGLDLKRFGPLDEAKLIALHGLEADFWQARAIKAIAENEAARALVEVVHCVEQLPDARQRVIAALADFKSWPQLTGAIEELLDTIEPTAVPALRSDDRCIFLNDVPAMRDAARRFDRSLVAEIPAVLDGRKRFAIWDRYRCALIIALANEGALGWRVYKIYGCRGRSPSRDERQAVEAYFATKHIAVRESVARIAAVFADNNS